MRNQENLSEIQAFFTLHFPPMVKTLVDVALAYIVLCKDHFRYAENPKHNVGKAPVGSQVTASRHISAWYER